MLPVIPLRDMLVFPTTMLPLYIGRDKSVNALEEATTNKTHVVLVYQQNPKDTNPSVDSLGRVGVACDIISTMKFPDNSVKIIVEAKHLVRINSYVDNAIMYLADVEEIEQKDPNSDDARALIKVIKGTFDDYVKVDKRATPEFINQVGIAKTWDQLCYVIAANMSLKLEKKIELLETTEPMALLEKILSVITGEIEMHKVEKKIQNRIKKSMEKSQKEYYLTEQMEAIQKELGGKDDQSGELEELLATAKRKKISIEGFDKLTKEVKRLKQMSPMSAESAVSRNYIETVVALPWGELAEENRDISHAEEILNRDHYGLEKVKDRILEQLAVMQLNPENRGTIICLAGPPGVGKTSLAKSVAEAQGREFVRISLGGVKDESEIRGHRRTYVGAMPGKILSSLKRTKTNNPLILLDEIDKMGSDHRGDPASAMLEVLDPEQNKNFVDHFLDMEYDLSKVLFFCTANYLENVPRPLLDRMEIVKLSSYTDIEKAAIAKKYLIPKQSAEAGLENIPVTFAPGTVEHVISGYTKESGVRSLERTFGKIFRKLARKVITSRSKVKNFTVDNAAVEKLLDKPRYKPTLTGKVSEVGVTNGMAWTEVGGDLLPVEVAIMPGKGVVIVTGKLGDVMKESAQAAMSYVRSRATALGIDAVTFEKNDLHIHVPDGATPKDGPSAGITITTSIVSAITKIAVRKEVAMTGEVSLLGKVLPIGGLKEKVIAAHKAGCTTILCPKENEQDIKDIPKSVRDDLRIVCVEHVDEVLMRALDVKNPREVFKGLVRVKHT